MIGPFTGPFRWLSNFYGVPGGVEYDGLMFPTVEHAYQSAKFTDQRIIELIRQAATPVDAKQLAREHKDQIVLNWESIRQGVMYDLLKQKFRPGTELAARLAATGNEPIEEVNSWGDTLWGTYKGRGLNLLGKLLMQVRAELVVYSQDRANPGSRVITLPDVVYPKQEGANAR